MMGMRELLLKELLVVIAGRAFEYPTYRMRSDVSN
jgi:hypothetical protein